MNSFHTDSQSAVWSCGEDQTAAWSETDSVSYNQDGVAFDWGAAGPVTVSKDLLWDMRGYSRFVVGQRLGIQGHLRRVAECQCRARLSRDYRGRGAQPQLQLFMVSIHLPRSLQPYGRCEYTMPDREPGN